MRRRGIVVLISDFYEEPGAAVEAVRRLKYRGSDVIVFHVLEGTVTVVQGDDEERVDAPGVVLHERGVTHGARNDTDETAVLTASLCPLPGGG